MGLLDGKAVVVTGAASGQLTCCFPGLTRRNWDRARAWQAWDYEFGRTCGTRTWRPVPVRPPCDLSMAPAAREQYPAAPPTVGHQPSNKMDPCSALRRDRGGVRTAVRSGGRLRCVGRRARRAGPESGRGSRPGPCYLYSLQCRRGGGRAAGGGGCGRDVWAAAVVHGEQRRCDTSLRFRRSVHTVHSRKACVGNSDGRQQAAGSRQQAPPWHLSRLGDLRSSQPHSAPLRVVPWHSLTCTGK